MKICQLIFFCGILNVIPVDGVIDNANYTDCHKSLIVLERALYGIEGNLKNLINVFFPPRKLPTAFVNVMYQFQDEYGDIDDDDTRCIVTYVWALGGFLLVQPPKIFRFTSLFFNNKVDDLNELKLTLPLACRKIVSNSSTGRCSCRNEDRNLLDVLTEQLRIYAKYNDPNHVVRDDLSKVKALCDEELEDRYFNTSDWGNINTSAFSINIFLLITVFIPVICVFVCTSILKSIRRTVHTKIINPKNHANLVALLLCGTFLSYYIIACDICAIHYAYSGKHELNRHNQSKLNGSFNFIITKVLLGFDVAACIISHFLFLFNICSCGKNKGCKSWTMCFCSCIPFCLIFGFYKSLKIPSYVRSDEKGDNEEKEKDKVFIRHHFLWTMMFCFFGPFVCVTSHVSFILISWLTDPAQATSIALVYLAIFFFYFITIRQCYASNINANILDSTICKLLCGSENTIWQCLCSGCWYVCSKAYCGFGNCVPECSCSECCGCLRNIILKPNNSLYVDLVTVTSYEHRAEGSEGATVKKAVLAKDPDKPFKGLAFFLSYVWGWFIAVIVVFTIIGFIELPLSTFDLPNYLLNLLQVFVVFLSVLVTYRILSTAEPEILKFLSNFRAAFTKKNDVDKINQYENYDDIEAVGDLAGELAYRVKTHLP